LQVDQHHFEQLLCAQCSCVDCGGLRKPRHVRFLHVFGLRAVRRCPGMRLLRLLLACRLVHSDGRSHVPGLLRRDTGVAVQF
jgi:hypothetical protein